MKTNIKDNLRRINIWFKILILISGGCIFFFLFPFIIKYRYFSYGLFVISLFLAGFFFTVMSGKRGLKIILSLWGVGTIVYFGIVFLFILKEKQPLPYVKLEKPELIFYYFSYPLRLLGVFFTGLIFMQIVSPVDFSKWGRLGLYIALVFRSFEFSLERLEMTRVALIMEGLWPDPYERKSVLKNIWIFFKGAVILVSTAFRNIILWFPWAWIVFNSIKKELGGNIK